MNKNIRLDDSFKLYIPLKDKILFESVMQENGIDYYSNINEQPNIAEGIRYFLLSSDKVEIDRIIAANQIVSSNESNTMLDFKDYGKLSKVFIVALIVLLVVSSFIVAVAILNQ